MILVSEPFVGKEEKEAAQRVLDSGWFIHGKELEAFEKEFANYIGVKSAVGCSNGTTAIELALQAVGVGEGDEVIVPSHTAFPTVEPVYNLGARPVFIDINEETMTINPDSLETSFDPKVKAVIGVHLYGHPFDVRPVREFCESKGILLVEDACQAHGAEYDGKKVGSLGDVACFSFYPSKNMTVCGDGGMVLTNRKDIEEKVRLLSNHGMEKKYDHVLIGHNYRMGEMEAAVGREQLKKLERFNERRRAIAKIYNREFSDVITKPVEKEWAKHVYHLYVIRTVKRDLVRLGLEKEGIKSEIHYPIPVHKLSVIGSKAKLEKTEKIVKEILSIPLHPKMTDSDVRKVVDAVNRIVS